MESHIIVKSGKFGKEPEISSNQTLNSANPVLIIAVPLASYFLHNQ